MRRCLLLLVLVGLAFSLLSGCSRKRPTTAPEMPVDTTSLVTPGPVPEAPAAAAAPDPADPLAGDLAAVNAYLRSQGLLNDVFYAYDSSDLSQEARRRLAANARFLNEHPVFEALIEGHCDERGTPEYNLALGEKRAAVARDYLTALGVDESRLRTLSYGEERPVCTASEESCWSQNRRAHFLVTGRRSLN